MTSSRRRRVARKGLLATSGIQWAGVTLRQPPGMLLAQDDHVVVEALTTRCPAQLLEVRAHPPGLVGRNPLRLA